MTGTVRMTSDEQVQWRFVRITLSIPHTLFIDIHRCLVSRGTRFGGMGCLDEALTLLVVTDVQLLNFFLIVLRVYRLVASDLHLVF